MLAQKKIIRAAGLIGIITVLSRILGLVRDAVIASGLGAGYINDCFQIAFEIPSLARRVLGEGALSAFIVPVFAKRQHHQGNESAWRFAANVFNVFFILTLILTILGIIFAGYIFSIFGGLKYIVKGEYEWLQLGTNLTRIMFPFLMLLTLVSISMGLLHSHRHFTTPALGSVALNLIVISLGISFLSLQPRGFVYILAVAVIIGETSALLIMLPALIKRGFYYTFYINLKDPQLLELFKMMLPALFGVAVVQVNIAVDLSFANWLGAGTPTAIRFSNRLIQFPLAIFAISLSTAILPSLSKNFIHNEMAELRSLINYSMQIIIVIFLPVTVGLIILGAPLIEIFFQRGRWTAEATSMTYFALIFYALGLLPLAALRIITPLYYARQDLKTPVKAATIALIANIILNFVFFHFTPLRQGGLALATSIAAAINFFILYWLISRKFGSLIEVTLWHTLSKTFICSLIMGVFCFFSFNGINLLFKSGSLIAKLFSLLTSMSIGVLAFFILARIFRIQILNEAIRFLLRRREEKINKPKKRLTTENTEGAEKL